MTEQGTEPAPIVPAPDEADRAASPLTYPAPFWRRIAALLVDVVALGVAFWIAGIFASRWFAALGPWGRLAGGAVGVAYFGFCGSSLAGGQTLGKRLARIAVRRRQGGNVPLGLSLVRATLLMLPATANKLALGSSSWVVPTIATIVLFGLAPAMLYLFVFNRPTRQSVHDLAVASIVVREDQAPENVQGTLWRPHLAIIAALLLGAAGLASLAFLKLRPNVNLDALLAAQRQIAAVADTDSVEVLDNVTYGTGGRKTWISVSAMTYVKAADEERLAREIAKVVFRAVPGANTRDRIIINISSGYDVLFARWWRGQRWNYTPSQWQERVSK